MSKNSTIMTSLAKRAGVIALSATLSVAAFAGTAYAYFTSHTQAEGSHTIELGYNSEISEEIENGNKSITMMNTGDTEIMVRVQLFYGTGINGNITVETPGAEGWVKGGLDGQETWTYTKVLAPNGQDGDKTTVLPVNVSAPAGTDLSSFDVTVIGQTSLAYYDEAGNPHAVLWEPTNNGDDADDASQAKDEN